MNQIQAVSIEYSQIKVGTESCFELTIDEEAIDQFAKLSGDFNPLHMKSSFAQSRGFQSRVVHGAYLTALISRMIGMYLPGENALIQQIQMKFRAPVYCDNKVFVSAVVSANSESVKTIVIDFKIETLDKTMEKILAATGKAYVGFTKV